MPLYTTACQDSRTPAARVIEFIAVPARLGLSQRSIRSLAIYISHIQRDTIHCIQHKQLNCVSYDNENRNESRKVLH